VLGEQHEHQAVGHRELIVMVEHRYGV